MVGPGALAEFVQPIPPLAEGEALVRVAGCGACHTDVGFLYEGVRTRHPLPLVLGHEIAGFVEAARGPAEALVGRAVVVPAVIPCGTCAPCRAGRGAVCRAQVFPGNDVDGGFASHVVVPGHALCEVPGCISADQRLGRAGVTLRELAVVADAVSTAWQANLHAGVDEGDFVVVVGAGGVGSFILQFARQFGAQVVAVDVRPERLQAAKEAGAIPVDARAGGVRRLVREVAGDLRAREWGWKIFEASGTTAGQVTAWELLAPASTVVVVGYTREQVSLRLSNLMALDATARGVWGCLPVHYPDVIAATLDGEVDVASAVTTRPLKHLPDVLAALHAGTLDRRVVLVPPEEA
jgi:6-hydroxycyclohex-1-ene-1-carbonyl-CoA dehydrogenase